MVEQKYDEIVMLVHPLFDVFTGSGFYSILKNASVKDGEIIFNEKCDKTKVELFKKQISVSLATYRKTIKEYKAPNRLFLIIDPLNTKAYSEIRGFPTKQLINYAKSELKDQLVIYSKFSLLSALQSELKEIFLKLKPKVKLIGFGEWTDGCVRGQMKALTTILSSQSIKITNSKILLNRSVDASGTESFERNITKKDLRQKIISKEQKQENFKIFKKTSPIKKVINKIVKFKLK